MIQISREQKDRIDRCEEANFFIVDKEEIDHSTFILSITGTTGNVYTININPDLNIICNCPDYTKNRLNNIFCKHICFVHFKIGKIQNLNMFKPDFLLNFRDYNKLLRNIRKYWKWHKKDPVVSAYKSLIESLDIENDEDNKKIKQLYDPMDSRNLKEDCPICCLSLETEIVKCPDCKNSVHIKCIDLWIRRKPTCVYCRSDIWEIYQQIIEKEQNKNSKYINLRIV